MLKKLLKFVCILIMVSGSCALAEDDYIGTWVLTTVKQDGVIRDAETESIPGKLYVYDDGLGLFTFEDNAATFSWEKKGNQIHAVIGSRYDADFLIDDNIISFGFGGYEFSFKKRDNGAVPNTLVENDINKYKGVWNISRLYIKNRMLDKDFFPHGGVALELQVVIDKQEAKIKLDYNGQHYEWLSGLILDEGNLVLDDSKIFHNRIALTESNELKVVNDSFIALLSRNSETSGSWICPDCGNNAGGNFCSNCGRKYSEELSDFGQSESSNQNELVLTEGTYIIGEDIKEGKYRITCIEAVDPFGTISATVDGVSGLMGEEGNGLNSFLNSYISTISSIAGDPTMTIRVLDSYGYTVKESELKKGESVIFELKKGSSINIYNGKCKVTRE